MNVKYNRKNIHLLVHNYFRKKWLNRTNKNNSVFNKIRSFYMVFKKNKTNSMQFYTNDTIGMVKLK